MAMFTERSACPACGGIQFKEIYSLSLVDARLMPYVGRKVPASILEDFGDTRYTLLKCACGLIFQQNVLSDCFLAKMYDEWVLHREQIPLSAIVLPNYANELYTIASLFKKPVQEIRVLDYGLGAGKWAKVAKAIGFDTYGTDLSENLIDDAVREGIKAFHLSKLDNQQFDFINTEQVFEHLARPKETLAQLAGCLAPKGVIKISVPDGRSIEKLLPRMDWSAKRGSKYYLVPVTPLVHINTFTDAVIKHMGRMHGLTPVRPGLRNEYNILDVRSLKGLVKSVLRPIYRRIRGTTYVFLRKR